MNICMSSTRVTRGHGLRLDCEVRTNTLSRVEWCGAAARHGQMRDTEIHTVSGIICIDNMETFSLEVLMEA